MKNGWHQVTAKTRLRVEAHRPVKVETTRRDLDAALDEAARYFGEPLEKTRQWRTDDGRELHKDHIECGAIVTCGVATAAEVHGDG